jgi:hypothetical protein
VGLGLRLVAPASNSGSRKRQQEDVELEEKGELEDTATSPIKKGVEKSAAGTTGHAKKQLVLSEGGTSAHGVPPPPPQYISPRDRKKQKKNEEESASSKAGSFEGCRQSK